MSETPSLSSRSTGVRLRCAIHEPDGSVCGEPVMIGAVCYDHAKMGPRGEPFCPITGEHGEPSSDYDWRDPALDREQEQMLARIPSRWWDR